MSSQFKMNYHEVLEIGPFASQQEIIDAYRRLALIRHPDKNPGSPNACAAFQELQNAYENLITEDHRTRPARRPHQNSSENPPQSPPPSPPPSPPRTPLSPPRSKEEEEQIMKEREALLTSREKRIAPFLKRAIEIMARYKKQREEVDEAFIKAEQDTIVLDQQAQASVKNPPTSEQLRLEKELRRKLYQQHRANIDPYYEEAKKRVRKYEKIVEKLKKERKAFKKGKLSWE